MLLKLLFLFTVIPLIELALLIPLGQLIGLWPTIGLVVATGLLGAVLGKLEGLRAWHAIQDDLRQGTIPADSLLDGLAVFIAGVFLITPGVLTDIAGLVLLIPPLRRPLKNAIRARFKSALEKGTSTFFISQSSNIFGSAPFDPRSHAPHSPFGGTEQGDIIDITPDRPGDSTDSDSDASLPRQR
ncbi:FxsA family protein [Bradymonadaceae bacterium TMQ3]|uniref:FxsA family protein n=1 Tax=Lujinxingia sediminis TaxID=2480984 RepID=A0ABY0CYI8_9DELT|nr:FxsA family protein [Lujinxingia sediminis]RDV39311.1 FxsA family protein [Bradymonadaceae bacterium TMQ3]RVU48651.1 FxsA family protein [Lujinxingia sediminis]TXC77944.1 FxsA family protein [Bradymonadales bacterium TMQ1]